MRTSRVQIAIALAALIGAAGVAHAKDGRVQFRSVDDAYAQGISAFRSGHYAHAIDGLEYAAQRGNFLARYYLAGLYADSSSPYTDHKRAYELYLEIANRHADIDPEEDFQLPSELRRPRKVAKALTALARYVQNGLPQIGLKPDLGRAIEYYRHAATFFDEEDAQFELAKIQLNFAEQRRAAARTKADLEWTQTEFTRALHWLSTLTQKGHSGAQAIFSRLYWEGLKVGDAVLVERNPTRALGLITLALENAPAGERIWIEDLHQSMFCGTSNGMRDQAGGLVAGWRGKFGRTGGDTGAIAGALADGGPRSSRSCADGEQIQWPSAGGQQAAQAPGRDAGAVMLQGSTSNPLTLDFRPAGQTQVQRPKP